MMIATWRGWVFIGVGGSSWSGEFAGMGTKQGGELAPRAGGSPEHGRVRRSDGAATVEVPWKCRKRVPGPGRDGGSRVRLRTMVARRKAGFSVKVEGVRAGVRGGVCRAGTRGAGSGGG